MHVLEYLSDPSCKRGPQDAVSTEYRLLCSGTLHRELLGDWSKSEVARVLLDPPLKLFAVSRPLDDYPLELEMQLTVPQVTEHLKPSAVSTTITYHPDEEVAADMAALLSLLCRRLITVAGKTSERSADYRHILFDDKPVPMPIATSMRRTFWRPHPFTVTTWPDRQEIQNYNPRPKAIDARRLTELLLGLPKTEHAESLVAAGRRYALSLELIHDRPDIAYQSLISTVETIAGAVLRTFQPPDEAKVEHKKSVYDLAMGLQLGDEVARKLAIEACKGEWWITRKFREFLTTYLPNSVWTEQDELFHQLPLDTLPKREQFEQVLGKIYGARSKATHEGRPFPVTASYTGGPRIEVRAGHILYGTDSPFPPVVWFERVVHSALCGYWEKAVPASIASAVNRDFSPE